MMRAVFIYIFAVIIALVILTTWRVSRIIFRPLIGKSVSKIRKYIQYSTVIKRPRGSTEVTVETAVYLLIYFLANVAACVIRITDAKELGQRCSKLLIFNSIPLYAIGNKSIILNTLLNIETSNYQLFHRWVGRICVLESIIHGVCCMIEYVDVSKTKISLFVLQCSLLVFSVLWFRRYLYESFKIIHKMIAVAVLVLLWFHINIQSSFATACLSVASAFWLLEQLMWVVLLIYRNNGKNLREAVRCFPIYYEQEKPQAVQLYISLQRPWNVRPGQYIYAIVPTIPHFFIGCFQSHPYMVAWSNGSEIVLLIERRRSFSYAINLQRSISHIYLDGPYGTQLPLNNYDKVLFLALGVGIAAHLMSIKHLIEAHNGKRARARRISLVWVLDSQEQQQLALNFLEELLDLDSRRIFTCYLMIQSLPNQLISEGRRGLWRSGILDLGWIINQEWNAEAGNMVVSMCGSPTFEERVRKAIRLTTHNIRLLCSGFKPDN